MHRVINRVSVTGHPLGHDDPNTSYDERVSSSNLSSSKGAKDVDMDVDGLEGGSNEDLVVRTYVIHLLGTYVTILCN